MEMELPEWLDLETRSNLFFDHSHNRPAPMALWGALLHLSRNRAPAASLIAADFAQSFTEWKIVWLTATDLIFVRARKDCGGWDGYKLGSDAGTAGDWEAWSRPVLSIAALELRDVRSHYGTESWRWESRTDVRFTDGTVATFPLSDLATDEHLTATNTFLDRLDQARADSGQ